MKMDSSNEIDPLKDFKPVSFLLKEEIESQVKCDPTIKEESDNKGFDSSEEINGYKLFDSGHKFDEKIGNTNSAKVDLLDHKDLSEKLKPDSCLLKEENEGTGTSDFIIKEEPDITGFIPTCNIKRESSTDCFVLLHRIKKDDYKNCNVGPEEVYIVSLDDTKPINSSRLFSCEREECQTDGSDDAEGTFEMLQAGESNNSEPRPTGIKLSEEDKLLGELRKLINDHKGEKICKLCQKSVPTRHHLMVHVKIKPFVCKTCNKKFTQKVSLQRHILHNHSTARNYSCPTCNKMFKTAECLRVHVQSVHSPEFLKCVECNKNFKSKHALTVHIRIHSNIRQFTCPVCDRSFVQRGNMKTHERLHYEDRPFACTLCPMRFKIKKDISRHMIKHSDTYKHSCDRCGKKFKYKNLYNNHILLHENSNAFSCDTCHKIMHSYDVWRRHKQTHEQKTFICDQCDKTVSNATALRSHKRYVHSTKTFTCDCGAQFTHRLYLLQHTRSHSSRVPLGCDLCSRTYLSKYNLAKHKKKHH